MRGVISNPDANRNPYVDCNSNAHSNGNCHTQRNSNRNSYGFAYTDTNAYCDGYTYSYRDADANANCHAYGDSDTYPGSHNQSGNERRKRFRYTQWLSQSAWVDDDCLFPVGHDNWLWAHHLCADPDWEYVPAYHCQHWRLECEPPLSFPNCSNQRWRHQLWRRQDLYHHGASGRYDQAGNQRGKFFSQPQRDC